MELEKEHRMLKITKRLKEARYIVLRPSLSLKDDHHSGKIDMLSMYKEMDKLVMVEVVCISLLTRDRDAKWQYRHVSFKTLVISTRMIPFTYERILYFPWEPQPQLQRQCT